ncbi:hypothetical protein [Falsiroseomonas tokyonensis]|uniref:SMODS and SLOG-associating 2TM effector domain-containing protein n=1 Tax=Falsiroseomonas tokyonensis TaxID=430521 RepID=A0ABV7BSZ3_9PROT|nr:hypothetical protein [Falsiroseomonas tokyonensis]MBU8538653.1 hypothetical protein [Falsiroseomonas tokyonensis]
MRSEALGTGDLPIGAFSSLGRLLREEEPQQASALVGEYPEISPWLAEVKVLGRPEREAGGSSQDSELRERRLNEGLMRTARLGLSAASNRVERLLTSLPRRARLAKRLKLFGSMISTVTSAGVIAALALAQQEAALATSFLSFSSSVIALVGEHIESPLFGTRKNLSELIVDLSGIELEIRNAQISVLEIAGSRDNAAAAGLARKVNEIAARLRALEVLEGVDPGDRPPAKAKAPNG